jgi:ABC exporter DevB family membrane fusion protein
MILAASVAGAYFILKSDAPEATARPVHAAAAQAAEPTAGVISAAGRVEPVSEELKIGSELDGKLKSVAVEEGDRVRRGQVLAVLENADYAARVETARAAVAEAEAVLLRVVNGSRTEERREAKAAIKEAEAVLDVAKAERARREMLLDRGAISRTEFDVFDREYRVAKAKLEAVTERAAFVDAEARADDRARAEAAVETAKARLREAEALLAKTVIRSPIDGVVLRRYRKTGESVSADGANPIVSLGDLKTLRIRVDVDESDVAHLRLGQKAWATADAYGGQRFTGRVVQIGEILGRKNIRTDEPTERVDTKILETLVELDPGQRLPVGLRVDTFIETR